MTKFPFRFKRTKESFEEGARIRRCQSSGSEYSVEDESPELYDLVNSFIENDGAVNEKGIHKDNAMNWFESEDEQQSNLDLLLSLVGVNNKGEFGLRIRNQTERACQVIEMSSSSQEFKRRLMSQLRLSGLDAGLCKSRWKKIRQFPVGDYEYVDVLTEQTRYIVEVSLSKEFTIARPTSYYQSLLNVIPEIFVGRVDELKQIVKLMCFAGKQSIKSRDMDVPPWRRNDFVVAKWTGSYKRTTNSEASNHDSYSGMKLDRKRSVDFDSFVQTFSHCGTQLGSSSRNVGMRVGNLAQLLNA